ncbi:MAG: YvcK family protein [Candidatus Omnitrophota bacterium]|nr:YvcK family protein [Candidatus Omnitrophota bacterium]
MKILKWLSPGMKIKRYVFQFIGGIVLLIMGIMLCAMKGQVQPEAAKVVVYSGSILIIMGIYFVIRGIRKMVKSLVSILLPQKKGELVDLIYRKNKLAAGAKITVIGGGTGLSTLLRGLKEYTSNITAIVTVADSGGSSGRIRSELDELPPGDIRNCLVALADTEPLMGKLFQYRFKEGEGLTGHNFGNLFITALSKITGDFEKAIKESSEVLAIRGRVMPSTLEKVTLVAEYNDGSLGRGEAQIPKPGKPIKQVYLQPADCSPPDEAINAINQADLIVLGPGSLYTSVMPNLLIKGILKAVSDSRAVKVYVCNIMTEAGETENYTAYDHLNALIKHTQDGIVEYCLVNTGRIPPELLTKYKQEGAEPVKVDNSQIRKRDCLVIEGEIISTTDFIRHDSQKLARVIVDLLVKNKRLRKRNVGREKINH